MTEESPLRVQAFRLREYLVEPSLNRITGPEGILQVEPRIMGVLAALARRPGEVWTREELLDTVWHDTVVNEETLTRAVFHLRKHLGDESASPRFIETIRKGGYRLVCPVEPAAQGTPSEEHRPKPEKRFPMLRPATAGGAVVLVAVAIGLLTRQHEDQAATPATPPIVVAFTSFPGQELSPSISRDGSLVAFTWRQEPDQAVDLYVKHRDAETPLRLTEDEAVEGSSTWSPDGGEVAFVRSASEGNGIFVVPAIGGPARLLATTTAPAQGLSWSPDGARIAFSDRAGNGAPWVVRELEVGSGAVRDLSSPPLYAEGDVRPTWSPDGSAVAFVRGDPAGNDDIWIMPASGGEARRLTQSQLNVRGLTWDPGSQHIVFSGFANGTYSLWRLDIRTGERSWLAIPGEWAFDPVMAPQSGTLVYVDNRFEKNIWRVDLRGGSVDGQAYGALLTSTRWDSEPQYAPDGTRVAFTSSRGGTLEIWLADADGSDPIRFTQFEGPFVGNPRWSPDGGSLAFFATSEGFAAVYAAEVAEGRPRRLTQPVANALPSSWSRDGAWIYFASDAEEGWQVWKIHPDGSGATRVTRSGAKGAWEDGTGSFLYLVRPDRPGLWRLPVGAQEGEDGMEVVLPQLPLRPGFENWLVQGHTFYTLVTSPEAPLAIAVDLVSLGMDTLAAVPGVASPSLTISPDGAFLLYSRIDRSEADLKLLEQLSWQAGRR